MKTISWLVPSAIIMLLAVTLLARNPKAKGIEPAPVVGTPSRAVAESSMEAAKITDVKFTLQTIADDGRLAFQGVGGEIDGLVNPDLIVPDGAVVTIALINADGMPHDIFFPDLEEKSSYVPRIGDQTEMTFQVATLQPGSYVYYCTVPGHRQAGQEGKFIVVQP